ncbi:hypothetical protein J2X58_000762 [Luteibacter sp. 3190]|nr:hypothetical protein [Luteibacter sp. 3190]
MWVSQATLDAQQAAVHARDRHLAFEAAHAADELRELLEPLIEDARFQALPLHHPFREQCRLAKTLTNYQQPSTRIMEWLALSGAVNALLAQPAATRWLSTRRPDALAKMRQLLAQRDGKTP